MKRIFSTLGIAYIAALACMISLQAQAAPASRVISSNVGVCNPSYPTRCIAVDANGAVPTTTTVTPSGGTSTNGSSTVATGGTFQTALAASATRKGCLVQNPTTATEPLYVSLAASPTTANGFSLAAGASFSCAGQGGYVVTDAIKVTAATTSHAFILYSQ